MRFVEELGTKIMSVDILCDNMQVKTIKREGEVQVWQLFGRPSLREVSLQADRFLWSARAELNKFPSTENYARRTLFLRLFISRRISRGVRGFMALEHLRFKSVFGHVRVVHGKGATKPQVCTRRGSKAPGVAA